MLLLKLTVTTLKTNKWTAYLVKKDTHKVHACLEVKTDGYLTALAEAHRLCAQNFSDCYVLRVVLE